MSAWRAAALAAAAGALLGGCGAGASADSPGVRVVSVGEASELLAAGDRTVIDVRTPDEYAGGHLAGAVLIDITDPSFGDRIRELDPDAAYLVYCRTANRSAGARALMDELGFVDVADIAGGVVAWVDAGLALDAHLD